ncbi:MAG: DedA family protein [Symbiobacterium sp.]|jgi:SNARE associated Golgi protein.|uniref:DedA family protein n=1 Tax=Symbiobacterium sp. TaxID=1971213 RepID=UPI003463D27B
MNWITEIMEAFGYPGIVLVILIENLFPPIPSEIVLPFAGFMTTQGSLTLFGVVVAATFGSVLGALALYGVGVWFGRDRIYRIARRYGRWLTVGEQDVQRAEDWFARYGIWTVFFCRMVPVLRSLISIPGGLVRMNLAVFVLYTALGSVIWNLLLSGVGAVLGAAWPAVSRWVNLYQDVVIALLALAVAAFLLYRLASRRER